MGVLELMSCLGVAFSSAAVLFAMVVAPHPERIILFMVSSFMWIVAISLTAATWTALAPWREATFLLILYAVAFQEVCRWLVYCTFVRLMRSLHEAGLQAALASSLQHIAPSAVASGLGIGVVQVLMTYGDFFMHASLPGSLYRPSCSVMSSFNLNAVCSAAFIALNVLLTVIGWTSAYPMGSPLVVAAMCLLHLLASASTTLNSATLLHVDGCSLSLPALLLLLLATSAIAIRCVHANQSRARDMLLSSAHRGS